MAFPQQAKIKMNFARIAVRLFVLIAVLAVVRSEPDALIRFADGSVVEFENSPLRQQLISPSLSPPAPSSALSQSASSEAHHASSLQHSILHGNNHRIETRSTKQHFCGELLVNALALVCKGNYYRKRSRISSTSTQPSAQSLVNYEIDYLTLQNKNDNENSLRDFFELIKAANRHHERPTRSVIGNGQNALLLAGLEERPSKRGVVDECCRKPCSTTTLSQYCSI